MSKKQLTNRLDSLFATLEQVEDQPTPPSRQLPPGWTWECDPYWRYLSISPEVETALQIPAADFIDQSMLSFRLTARSVMDLQNVVESSRFPAEVRLVFQGHGGSQVSVRAHLFERSSQDGDLVGWRGFAEVIPGGQSAENNSPARQTENAHLETTPRPETLARGFGDAPSITPWSQAARQSLSENAPVFQAGSGEQTAAIGVPVAVQGKTQGVLELLDDNPRRRWTEDERMLVQEVAQQLGLALENAQLYAAVQQELAERIKAEEEITSRNRDLATLNQIGQQLNRLASTGEILEQVFAAVGQLTDNSNTFIALFDDLNRQITFPVYAVDGQVEMVASQPADTSLVEHIIANRSPLLITTEVKKHLQALGTDVPQRVPASLLAVPMLAGEKVVGVICVQNFTRENAFDAIDAELLSTIASQASIALENARLFQQMQNALITIEVRERYQKNVARAVAALSETGTQSLNEVLRILGEAAQTSRVYYMQAVRGDADVAWQIAAEWCDGDAVSLLQEVRLKSLTAAQFPLLANELQEQGRFSGATSIMPPAERELLTSLNIRSFLAVAVPGKTAVPGFIAFDETGYDRPWGTEEIDALQMAAAALSNTIIREDLLDQLQFSLDESESLYNASRRLAVANGLQEMLAAITEGLRVPAINRAEILLMNYDAAGVVDGMEVVANWYSGWGNSPEAEGTHYQRADFENFKRLLTPSPLFFTDVRQEPEIAHTAQGVINLDTTSALAVLPLWVGKRQLGVLLLRSDVRHTFSERETRAYPPLVGQMAIAIENLRLFEQTQGALNETESLYQASAELNTAKTFEQILSVLRKYTWLGQTSENTSLNFFDPPLADGEKPGFINVVARYNPVTVSLRPNRYNLAEFPAAAALLNPDQPTILEDIAAIESLDEKSRQMLMSFFGARSAVFLPLVVGGQWVGFLLSYSEQPRKFPEEEIRRVMTLAGQAAVAAQNLLGIATAEQHADEAMLLFQTSRRLTQSANELDLYQNTLEACKKGVELNALAIHLFGTDTDGSLYAERAAHLADSGISQEVLGTRTVGDRFPYTDLLSEGQTVICADVENDTRVNDRARGLLLRSNMQAAVLIPLQVRGQNSGVLIAGRKEKGVFAGQEVTFLQTVATQLSVALDNYRLLQESQRRALELQTAAEIARDTSSTLALDTLLNRTVTMLAERFGFYFASIFLVDDAGIYALVREATGETGQQMVRSGHRVRVEGNSTIGKACKTQIPVVVNDVDQAAGYTANPWLPDTHSELAVPLIIGNKVVGVLDVHDKRSNAFSTGDVSVLKTLADQIGVAIENARAYELAQKAIDEMREVDRVKSQFLANMSHELRTPLNSIIGFSKVILRGIDGPVTDLQSTDLTAIFNSGQHLLHLINDILDLSKIEAGKMELSVEELDISDVINSVMPTASGLIKDKDVRLLRNIQPDLPKVKGDTVRIRQVIINFLSNAAKFTDSGSITVSAYTQVNARKRQEMVVTVEDTGPGIAEEDRSKLFMPFSQVDDSPTRKTGGTGLGLSICRSLIEMHGGEIGLLRSTVGSGSTFFFSLPMDSPNQTGMLVEEKGTDQSLPVILAIDDDPRVVSLYERYLSSQGYRVVALHDPNKAIEMAIKVHPMAITLDIMMPGRDGWTVLQDLKNEPETQHIPVIVCSILEEGEKGFSLGAADYLVKPILQDDLLHALARVNQDGQIKDVLVVDDDPNDQRLVCKILEEKGKFKVTTAQNGQQALDQIAAAAPDAVILDLFMPDMDGFTLMQKIREDEKLRALPLIVLTGADLSPEQHQRLAAFGQQALTKSTLSEKDLLVYVQEALQRVRQQSE